MTQATNILKIMSGEV